jgi:hypothetical protein
MVGWLVNNYRKRWKKNLSWSNPKYYRGIALGWAEKKYEQLYQDSQCPIEISTEYLKNVRT